MHKLQTRMYAHTHTPSRTHTHTSTRLQDTLQEQQQLWEEQRAALQDSLDIMSSNAGVCIFFLM